MKNLFSTFCVLGCMAGCVSETIPGEEEDIASEDNTLLKKSGFGGIGKAVDENDIDFNVSTEEAKCPKPPFPLTCSALDGSGPYSIDITGPDDGTCTVSFKLDKCMDAGDSCDCTVKDQKASGDCLSDGSKATVVDDEPVVF